MFEQHPNTSLNLDLAQFMATHWQQKPALIRQLIPQFNDPISAEELAGLAMEECVSSRIISNGETQHGPFETFETLSNDGASLLVQAVNHWHPESAMLFDQFRFIPNWRLDDLMVSYSTPQGSVGAHLDQYDVIIIQGEGKRRWRVGKVLEQHAAEVFCHGDEFDAVIDVEMQPGDALYIPPNCPHQGTTLAHCLNYSVGFRAPSVSEMMTRLADQLIDTDSGKQRFSDTSRQATNTPGQLISSDVAQLQTLLMNYIQSNEGRDLLISQLTEQERDLDLAVLTDEYTPNTLLEDLKQGAIFERCAGLIPMYESSNDHISLYIQGDVYNFNSHEEAWVQLLCDQHSIYLSESSELLPTVEFLTILSTLINQGYWYQAGA
ncbi:JmjC domain-containing protein [Echinimonas agarilytica]|uniref:Cupin domain-containing protein n=1 Tax=Echinimonas agarilytica TaxID=1215918 RepID=A0AA41W8G5_9GAMM|nr:cupin domain-containing protein [Echinimonas agarilytica]MCM2680776.1 cupin domain-containing protein [Echinimonas agarilytica]